MIIKLKKNNTLIVNGFVFKCSIGKNGTKSNKIEGDQSTPKGIYKFGELYWRNDRVKKPITKLKCVRISKKMAWCNDIKSKNYNKKVLLNSKIKSEKLFRADSKYDYFIVIKYNTEKIVINKGSAIFLHLTKNYNSTAGCIAVTKKDFLIILKFLDKNSKIKIY